MEIEAVIAESAGTRRRKQQSRQRMAFGLSLAFTIGWIVYVTASDQWSRVADHWASAVTMVFGSFVAGSTPQGGGAVAFPVFTKVLEVPAEVARTFSLVIQCVGMTAASLSMIVNRRALATQGLLVGAPAALTGFIVGYFTIVDAGRPFSPATIPGAYVKVLFTVIVVAMAFVTARGYRVQLLEQRHTMPGLNTRIVAALIIFGFVGGFVSSLIGSGADVFLYLVLVLLIGLSPRTGVATSVIVMTLVSWAGMVMFGLGDGHLAVVLSEVGDVVVGVGGRSVGAVDNIVSFRGEGGLDAARFDLFGMWLAASPVVVWGAPFGAFVSSRLSDRQLVRFVVLLAVAEALSTILFLEELRSSGRLIIFGISSLLVSLVGLWSLSRWRHRLLGLSPVDPDRSWAKGEVDRGPRLADVLREQKTPKE